MQPLLRCLEEFAELFRQGSLPREILEWQLAEIRKLTSAAERSPRSRPDR
ncbi:hypothetical protein [Thermoproteus uzoniensis]|nr:hypothetical protein [Thermoproteus uzoniensis]